MNTNLKTPFSNVQMELMKLFASNIPDEHLLELRKLMAKFLLEKAREKADKIWEEKGYDENLIFNNL
jgi:hypothetical protein